MRDYLSIGPVPCEESCQQLGPNYDPIAARAECNRFIELIRKVIGPEPEGCRLRVKSNPHDFGTYLDVVAEFDDSYTAAIDYAFLVESDAPTTWEAK